MTSETHGRGIVARIRIDKPGKETAHYDVTELDREMLIRACAHEGKPHVEVVRCLLQRFAWLYDTTLQYDRLQDLVQAYVQPINPKWFSNGSKHKKYISRLLRKGQHGNVADQKRRAKNRERYASEPIAAIDGRYTAFVDTVLAGSGDWSHMQGAIHYRAGQGLDNTEGQELATDFAEEREHWWVADVGHGFKAGVNWFFGVGSSKGLDLSVWAVGEVPTRDVETMKDDLMQAVAESAKAMGEARDALNGMDDIDLARLAAATMAVLVTRMDLAKKASDD